MSLEAILITIEIEAYEGRYVATIYIPGAYLHIDSYEEVSMILKGRLAGVLSNIEPKLYLKCVLLYKGAKVLYVKLQKSINRLLCSALLFYLKLATELKNNGVIINLYEPCVANKLVKG